ncbi:zinc-dependent alcohol dehydrogenase [Vibrio viridaestus]|uniref:Alcohol dehydrogenase n=1 Tax=Vibrio viridaestus TaxID=2487322 RepID=A0A3N9THI6_9VIBR|nr:alcohol dehydrogenase catalytic domain-containing protein [Vibrio viridaestus]RQW63313.1 alcohol dehydrogenase [Vibrio viridaestus]
MKAARLYGIGDIRIEDIAEDELKDNSVRVKVTAAGICGSDLHNFKTGQWLASVPVTPGHEFCGTITDIGSNVENFAIGDQVVADSRAYCGQCPACEAHQFNHCESLGFVGEVCNGGFAQFVTIDEKSLIKVPTNVAPSIAVLSEPLGVALRVVNQLSPERGDAVKVYGGGTIGGLTALLLQELYQCRIDLEEPNSDRKQLLSDIIDLDTVERYHCAVDATGVPAVINEIISNIQAGGKVALVGLPHANKEIDILSIVEKEIQLIGCSVFQNEQHQIIDFLERLAPKLEKLISAPIALDNIGETYQILTSQQVPYLKAVVQP